MGYGNVGVNPHAVNRVLPKIHDLCHGGSDTTCHGVVRTIQVVWVILVPSGLDQRSYDGSRFFGREDPFLQVVPLLDCFSGSGQLMVGDNLNLIIIGLQPKKDVFRQVF